MKKYMLVVVLILLLAKPFLGVSQEIFPSQKGLSVTITPKITRKLSGRFDYLYTVLNDESSNQTIKRIFLFVKGKVDQTIVKKPGPWPSGRAVPKGPDFPNELNFIGWRPAIYHGDDINRPPLDSVNPGELSEEFGVVDHEGPPRIIDWKVKGWAPTPVLVEGGEDEEDVIIVPEYDYKRGVQVSEKRYKVDDVADTLLNHAETVPNANPRTNAVTGKTIGPSEPPSGHEVLCDTFIIGLIGQVREAAALGWIKHDLRKDRDDDDDHGKRRGDEKGKKKGHEKDDDEGDDNGDADEMDDADKNLPGVVPSEIRDILSRSGDGALPGTAKSIIKKLMKVRRECMRGKFGNAREKLRALIKQVNAQRGKHLTEEAYALIKFNAEFLLEKL